MLLSLTKLGAAGALAMGVWLSGSAAQATTSRVELRGEGGAVGPAQSGECGKPGQPPCPLQDWMRKNVASALAANDAEALAAALEKAAKLSPDPTWVTWGSAASAGAAAAKKGDVAGARAACKTCHEAWRSNYRERFRTRPIPR